jgi:septum site-determining protein MinC
MESGNLALALDSVPAELPEPPALLRGTARGLEMVVQARAGADAIVAALAARLDEAPGFFRGSEVRIGVEDGPLAPGCLGRLDELAVRFELRIVEVGPAKPKGREAVPVPNLATGSAPSPAGPDDPPIVLHDDELTALLEMLDAYEPSFEEPTRTAVPVPSAQPATAEVETAAGGPRLVIGPVRSGVVLEHIGHLLVFGDVNPGAEVRASGSIVVLGRMRGTAHAGIGQDHGFIVALRLEPQQLRIGRMVARAGDSDTPLTEAEIAYVTGDHIVVERFVGKLPRNLATSL